MISHDLARSLALSGLQWDPAPGDQFSIQSAELESSVFTVSDLTIEVHTYPSGTILRFNGTTEWALDSVDIEQTLWLPSEEQLRTLLRGTFRSLRRSETDPDELVVEIVLGGRLLTFSDGSSADAYAQALLALITASAEV